MNCAANSSTLVLLGRAVVLEIEVGPGSAQRIKGEVPALRRYPASLGKVGAGNIIV